MSSSKTQQATTSTTTDKRQIAENGGVTAQSARNIDASKGTITASGQGLGVSNGSGVINLDVTPGAAFDLATHAIDTTAMTLSKALATTQVNAQTDSNQIAQQLIKIGLPVAALAFILKGR